MILVYSDRETGKIIDVTEPSIPEDGLLEKINQFNASGGERTVKTIGEDYEHCEILRWLIKKRRGTIQDFRDELYGIQNSADRLSDAAIELIAKLEEMPND
jgi:hypothetical protein